MTSGSWWWSVIGPDLGLGAPGVRACDSRQIARRALRRWQVRLQQFCHLVNLSFRYFAECAFKNESSGLRTEVSFCSQMVSNFDALLFIEIRTTLSALFPALLFVFLRWSYAISHTRSPSLKHYSSSKFNVQWQEKSRLHTGFQDIFTRPSCWYHRPPATCHAPLDYTIWLDERVFCRIFRSGICFILFRWIR